MFQYFGYAGIWITCVASCLSGDFVFTMESDLFMLFLFFSAVILNSSHLCFSLLFVVVFFGSTNSLSHLRISPNLYENHKATKRGWTGGYPIPSSLPLSPHFPPSSPPLPSPLTPSSLPLLPHFPPPIRFFPPPDKILFLFKN